MKTTCTVDGNTLIQDQKGTYDSVLKRELKDNKMVMVSFWNESFIKNHSLEGVERIVLKDQKKTAFKGSENVLKGIRKIALRD